MSSKQFETVIGIEVHVQLQTKTKLFCGCSSEFGASDNVNTCPVCTAMPGALPVVNEKAVEFATKTGLALSSSINRASVFSRKNYFYPDSPKGYQISQFDKPICEGGYLDVVLKDGIKKRIGITRAHLEEDAGKSTHHSDYSLINLNRSCVPLLEIVSEPEIRSAHEAAEYVKALRSIVQYINVCDGNLEEGSMRADCNVSIRPLGQEEFGTKVELKNINSFRFIEKAINFEVERQTDLYLSGEKDKIVQETRLYDADKNRTYSMRSKEEAHDYRYFPEPDLLYCSVADEMVTSLKKELPELPLAKSERFQSSLGIPEHDAHVLTQQLDMANFFEEVATISKNPKAASNWIMTELMRELKESKMSIGESQLTASKLASLIKLIDQGKISGKIAKTVFEELWKTGDEPEDIVERKALIQISDINELETIIDEIIKSNPSQLEQYRSGKEKIFGFFVGQTMKKTKGMANPELVNKVLKDKLKI